MYEMIGHVHETDSVRNQLSDGQAIYGEDVGDAIVDFLRDRWEEEPSEWAHERLGFEGGKQDFEHL